MAQGLGNPAPELSCCTEFRDRHELVVVSDQTKADRIERVGHTDPGFGEQPQIVGRRSDRAGQFPAGIGTAVVERPAVHRDRADAGGTRQPSCDSDDFGNCGRRAVAEQCGERIGTQVDGDCPGALGPDDQAADHFGRCAEIRAGVEDYRSQLQVDTLQPAFQIGHRDPRRADLENQCTDTVDQRIEDGAAAVCGDPGETRRRELFGDLPAGHDVAVRIAAAGERPVTGKRGLGQRVQRGVEGADRKVLIGRRIE